VSVLEERFRNSNQSSAAYLDICLALAGLLEPTPGLKMLLIFDSKCPCGRL
jgi:hypothetical protein